MTPVTPTWVQLAYLACAVCFILALKGLSGPKTARTGNLLGAAAAVVACRGAVLLPRPRPRPADPGGDRGRHGRRRRRRARVQMTQMPQMVALFNGVGGGAAALVALLELHEIAPRGDDVGWFVLAATAFTIAVGSVSFAGLDRHLRQAAGADDVAAGGLPRAAGGLRPGPARRARAVGADGRRRRRSGSAIVLALVGLLVGVLLVLPVGRRRRTDRDLAAQRVHRPDGRRRRLRPVQHACCWWPAPSSARPAPS